jgi:nitrite reductase/ring-hydroxylating ferredoxin subunit
MLSSRTVGRVDELPPGSVTIVPVGKFGVGVFNVNGSYFALTNYCPHRGGPLCLGPIVGAVSAGDRPYEIRYHRPGEFVRCPWHGWEYEIRTGRAVAYPDKSIRTHPVTVRDGMVVLEDV